MPDWLIVTILGIVEGITEFLPVSSTGHLLLFEHWLHVQKSDLFNIVIQCGAVIAVIPLFRSRIQALLTKWNEPETRDYFLKLITAFVITAVIGLVIDKKGFKLQDNPLPIGIAMLAGGILFLAIEWLMRGKKGSSEITWTIALAVGLGQILAGVFPGSSRSGTTILLSLMLGLSRPAATEFSFLVGIPTMLAAGGWKILKQLRHHEAAGEDWGMLLLATVVATIVSFIAVKWLLRYIQTHTFIIFGWYRIVVGIVILVMAQSLPVEPPKKQKVHNVAIVNFCQRAT